MKQLRIIFMVSIMILVLCGCTNKEVNYHSGTVLPTHSPTAITPDVTPEPDVNDGEANTRPAGIDVEITTENVTIDGNDYISQTAVIDMNGDGTDEIITAKYIDYSCEITVSDSDGELSTFVWWYENIIPKMNFADFDTRDSAIQLFLEGEGPSGDPYTQIFSFDGAEIVQNAGMPEFITDYDGMGRIYTHEMYNVNSYFDLYKGLTPLPKENIIGTEIKRSFNIILCSKPGNGYTAAILSSSYEENLEEYTEGFKDEFICLVPENAPLIVLDIEFITEPWDEDSDELYPVPWLKVRTPDGTEGWFIVFYGD